MSGNDNKKNDNKKYGYSNKDKQRYSVFVLTMYILMFIGLLYLKKMPGYVQFYGPITTVILAVLVNFLYFDNVYFSNISFNNNIDPRKNKILLSFIINSQDKFIENIVFYINSKKFNINFKDPLFIENNKLFVFDLLKNGSDEVFTALSNVKNEFKIKIGFNFIGDKKEIKTNAIKIKTDKQFLDGLIKEHTEWEVAYLLSPPSFKNFYLNKIRDIAYKMWKKDKDRNGKDSKHYWFEAEKLFRSS